MNKVTVILSTALLCCMAIIACMCITVDRSVHQSQLLSRYKCKKVGTTHVTVLMQPQGLKIGDTIINGHYVIIDTL